MKRILYALLIVGIIAGVILVGYFLRYRGVLPGLPGEVVVAPPPGELPLVPPGTLFFPGADDPNPVTEQPVFTLEQPFGPVLNNRVAAYFIDEEGGITVMEPDGQIVHVSARGATTVLSGTTIIALARASFSEDGSKILAVFGDRIAPQTSIFDVPTRVWTPLDATTRSPAWAPHSTEVVYFRSLPDGQSALQTLDLRTATAKPKELLRLYQHDIEPHWNAPTSIILAPRASAAVAATILRFSTTQKTIVPILKNKAAVEILWNGRGDRGVMFSGTPRSRGGELSLVDGNGKALYRLNFGSLPRKCVFGERRSEDGTASATSTEQINGTGVLYCAIPREREQFARSILPDDYLKRAFFTTDDFYAIDLKTGGTVALFTDPAERVDAETLRVTGNRLYFINRYDRRLYALRLAE